MSKTVTEHRVKRKMRLHVSEPWSISPFNSVVPKVLVVF